MNKQLEIQSLKNRDLLVEYEQGLKSGHLNMQHELKLMDIKHEILRRMQKHDCESMEEYMDH